MCQVSTAIPGPPPRRISWLESNDPSLRETQGGSGVEIIASVEVGFGGGQPSGAVGFGGERGRTRHPLAGLRVRVQGLPPARPQLADAPE